MKRTTIFLTAEQHDGLRRLAFEQRTSIAGLLRHAAIQILEDEEDVQVGLKSLSDEEGIVSWDQYMKLRNDSNKEI
ncbi:MAG: hypothetical protein JSW38_01590 [Dehalococcoidia bacterium]|nr:MAG: hypothetical protein JSW38_01590 [Dehalococcoidia bacterium]